MRTRQDNTLFYLFATVQQHSLYPLKPSFCQMSSFRKESSNLNEYIATDFFKKQSDSFFLILLLRAKKALAKLPRVLTIRPNKCRVWHNAQQFRFWKHLDNTQGT